MTTRKRPARPSLPAVDFDWSEAEWQRVGQRLVDLVSGISTGWSTRRPSPSGVSTDQFRDPLPESPLGVDRVIDRLTGEVAPGAAFNGHPSWFGYITASPVPAGVVGDFVATALNQNTALHRIAATATAIELQTVTWITSLLGLDPASEGVFVSGGQFANITAQAVMRDSKLPWDVRRYGLAGPEGQTLRPRIYVSAEAHYCHEQAAELLGLGREAIVHVPVDDQYRLRMDVLAALVAEDQAAGRLPIGVIGTAGTVGTGAVDPLGQIAAFCQERDLWFHVDGSYGAFAILADRHPADLRAMALADSVACDPHKWLFAPIDAGVTIIRQPGLLERSFAFHASYLQTSGPSDRVDLVDRTPENSRPFRALKVWTALQAHGRQGYQAMIERNLHLAEYLEALVEAEPDLDLVAPRELSIVCWRVEPTGLTDPTALDALQREVIAELEARGVALVSNATLRDDRTAIRACIVNFRTAPEDIEALVAASAAIGREIAARGLS